MLQKAINPSLSKVSSGFAKIGWEAARLSVGNNCLKNNKTSESAIAVIIAKCTGGIIWAAIITEPISAPEKPARLHTPWNEAIIERPYIASTPTAWVFAAMLHIF